MAAGAHRIERLLEEDTTAVLYTRPLEEWEAAHKQQKQTQRKWKLIRPRGGMAKRNWKWYLAYDIGLVLTLGGIALLAVIAVLMALDSATLQEGCKPVEPLWRL